MTLLSLFLMLEVMMNRQKSLMKQYPLMRMFY